jgi:hypothetical protein
MKYKEFVIKNYPNGFTFEPMAMRLIEEKAGIGQWDAEVIDELKSHAVKRQDGVYVFPEQITDEEIQLQMIDAAEDWIERFGCFSLSVLRQQFEYKIKNLSDHIEDFETFFNSLYGNEPYKSVWYNTPKGRIRFTRDAETSKDDALKTMTQRIETIIGENYGTVTEYTILEQIPALDAEWLAAIIKDHLPEIVKTVHDGLTCYQRQEELGIPEDFAETVSIIVHQLEDIDLLVCEVALHTVLSEYYRINFNKTYQLEWKDFRRLVAQHYQGERREWKNGIFG